MQFLKICYVICFKSKTYSNIFPIPPKGLYPKGLYSYKYQISHYQYWRLILKRFSFIVEKKNIPIKCASSDAKDIRHHRFYIWYIKMFGFLVLLILLTGILFWKHIQNHWILSFMVLSVYFILWTVPSLPHLFYYSPERKMCSLKNNKRVLPTKIYSKYFSVKRNRNDLYKICASS